MSTVDTENQTLFRENGSMRAGRQPEMARQSEWVEKARDIIDVNQFNPLSFDQRFSIWSRFFRTWFFDAGWFFLLGTSMVSVASKSYNDIIDK